MINTHRNRGDHLQSRRILEQRCMIGVDRAQSKPWASASQSCNSASGIGCDSATRDVVGVAQCVDHVTGQPKATTHFGFTTLPSFIYALPICDAVGSLVPKVNDQITTSITTMLVPNHARPKSPCAKRPAATKGPAIRPNAARKR
ncbi:MAG: hypothetical protein CM15mP74_36370 [Halieaceae bacterium]|nr:MAG: hypothetical protein CM15mP74_36370 [Halieaceae bacterium]